MPNKSTFFVIVKNFLKLSLSATLLSSCAAHYTYQPPDGRSSWQPGHWENGVYMHAEVIGTQWIPDSYSPNGAWIPGHWVY